MKLLNRNVECDMAPELMEELRVRFWRKVTPGQPGECWPWRVGVRSGTYGQLMYQQKHYWIHRLSYLFHHGPIPRDHVVCHKCDNEWCFNPEHLFVGTLYDNYHDAVNKGRIVRPSRGADLKKRKPRSATGHRTATLETTIRRMLVKYDLTPEMLIEEIRSNF